MSEIDFRSRAWRSLTPRQKMLERIVRVPFSGCWIWMGQTTTHGYGRLGRTRAAHRAAYVVFVGPIPPGLHVLHRCDVPSCVNPAHLFLGTHSDNMVDMCRKGRGKRPLRPNVGADNPAAKITEQEVLAIRAAEGITQRDLAWVYGVSQQQISKIRQRENWGRL